MRISDWSSDVCASDLDGAPELKQAQRQRAQEILSGSARTAVADATVILTNPTHFSVALRYRPGVDAAPVVVARGRGDVALAIRELARAATGRDACRERVCQ